MDEEKRVEELRKLFPVIDHWTYLYNGSIHACPKPVGDAMRSFLAEWERGGEAAFFIAYEKFGLLREKFAKLIHVDPKNIAITESTTAALNLAARILQPQKGQNVVVTELAFMSNTYSWLASYPYVEARFAKSTDGKVVAEEIESRLDENTVAVSICAVTVGSGFRYDLAEIKKITAERKIPVIIDAAQAVGLVDIDVKQLKLDFLASTSSKWLMGPAGVGFLYIDDSYMQATPPAAGWLAAANTGDWNVKFCELHGDAMRFQGGIPNLIGIVGALAGIELIEQIGRDFIETRVKKLTSYVINKLEEIDVSIWTPRANHERAGIVFFRTDRVEELHKKLKDKRIYCGNFLGGIRIDPTFYNTYAELDRFIAVVKNHVLETDQ